MTTSNLSLSPSPAAARSFVAPHSPDRKFSKQALEKFETPEAVTELCLSFCELQACHPEDLDHDEREAFWLNVLNACTLAWICTTDPQKLQSNLFPMHVFLGFLQKSTVNVGGQIFSLQDCGHPFCEVSFGIFYPLRFGYPRLQVYYPQALPDQLLLNCAQYLFETVAVEPKKRRVTLPPLLKPRGERERERADTAEGELEDMLEVAREKKMKVAPPPGRPLPGENPRQRRYVAS
eukprot:g21753.t1